jgi:hypothetical protein
VSGDTIFVGRPSHWSNPFEGRSGIGQARATILYRHWLEGIVTAGILRICRFSEAEIEAMERWRRRILANARDLAGKRLIRSCRPNAAWCHRPVLGSYAAMAR